MHPRDHRGFTLLEILVVIAILGLMVVAGVSRMRTTENLKTVVRQLSTIMKKTRSFAKLNQKTYRLVIKMSDSEGHSYWVESSSERHLIDPKSDDKYKLKMDKEKEQTEGGFGTAADILKSPKMLPKDWGISLVESSGHPESQSTESSYIYFFPEGVSEEAVVQISNKKKGVTWTLHLNPLLSTPEIYQEAKVLKDFLK